MVTKYTILLVLLGLFAMKGTAKGKDSLPDTVLVESTLEATTIAGYSQIQYLVSCLECREFLDLIATIDSFSSAGYGVRKEKVGPDVFLVTIFRTDGLPFGHSPDVLKMEIGSIVILDIGKRTAQPIVECIQPKMKPLQIGPQPLHSDQQLHVEVLNPEANHVKVWDILGRPCGTFTVQLNSLMDFNVDLFPPNIYVMEVYDAKGRSLGREKWVKLP